MAYKQKGFSPFTIIKRKKKKPVDDDTDKMSNREYRRHERKVHRYNKKAGNYVKMRDNSRLMDKLKDQEIDLGRKIKSLRDKKKTTGLNDSESARLKDLKREFSSNQKLLKNIRKAK
tara:strand:- start:204 stop:554 length:351 start_codon:yes stop_codon:yes gene_type:complete